MFTENTQQTIKEFISHVYVSLRTEYPDTIIILQMPSAYLSIREDAHLLSRTLSIPLRQPTVRIPLIHIVFPSDAFDDYMDKLEFKKIIIVF